MNTFEERNVQGIKLLELTKFTAKMPLKAYFSTRTGGVSQKPYETLNMALHTGDEAEAVRENRKIFSLAAGAAVRNWITAEQVHGDRVAVIDDSFPEKGVVLPVAGIDALVTGLRKIPLVTFYADCVPLFFFDPANMVIALAHAGWKGTVLRIAAKTLATMQSHFGSKARECLVAIGPSIRQCCYQVDKHLAGRFRDEFSFAEEVLQSDGPGHWKLDLQKTNRLLLEGSGVQPANIYDGGLCTCCNNELFYSYRREGKTGRMAALLQLD